VDSLAAHGVTLVRAANPGPLTLAGTNTWVVGFGEVYVVDPGPLLPAHVDAIAAAVAERGTLAGIALTHSHVDHVESVQALQHAAGSAPVGAAADAGADATLRDGEAFGPLRVVAAAGHAPDHVAFVFGAACFTGDAVLGAGSVFIQPYPGAMAAYLDALRRLRALEPAVLCPGHGPPIWAPAAKLDEYLAHRLDRERRLLEALERGLRTAEELLDAVWDDAPAVLRPAAQATLVAHMDKLRDEGRLPDDVAGREGPAA